MHLSEPIISWLREPGEGLLRDLIQLLQIYPVLPALLMLIPPTSKTINHFSLNVWPLKSDT